MIGKNATAGRKMIMKDEVMDVAIRLLGSSDGGATRY